MSNYSIASISNISREQLSSQILSSESAPHLPSNLAIIDVRDSDHIGGHIRGSTHVPSSQLDYRLPELVRLLKGKETVVFHCALSQQRGPAAALRYLREKERLGGDGSKREEDVVEESREGKNDARNEEQEAAQKVVVLEGGFTKWQEKYGEDKRLTEAYQKDIWEFGY
ncbi:Cdc25 family phosphatase-like protein Ibp1 [Lindgomyces ingoldianus]|uniref:Cdc25 family phosphatase-like protein Ibp1 n=1 Tax=Lindgomyces ingoldianus TaxID=673940 RepID=A0ACB6R8V2_9PLEO|nr:Cdc25 family phosphatase-like protein Ibp1 [Lindgomyces ingoldianus]KAF2475708.1 Cdc25 family phosphatase-like protein Ibp1 [Lindgomyces ingoldianus]